MTPRRTIKGAFVKGQKGHYPGSGKAGGSSRGDQPGSNQRMTPSTKPARMLPPLSAEQTSLVRQALMQVKGLPESLNEIDSVKRLVKIRRHLVKQLGTEGSKERLAKRAIRNGLVATLVAAFIVIAVGAWRAIERIYVPATTFDDPVGFLSLFTFLFIASCIPFFIGLARAKNLRSAAQKQTQEDISKVMLYFDVVVVRLLLRKKQRY